MNTKALPGCGWLAAAATFWLAASASPGWAGVVLDNTRVVFDAGKLETSMTLSNPTRQPYAIQAWVNSASDDDSLAAPFIATPPLFRIDPRKEQGLRVLRTKGALAEDRESLYYLNIQEIPSAGTSADNVLKVALRTRIKLFYRPAGLPGAALEAGSKLHWSLVTENGQHRLRVENPTPFHVSFIGIKVAKGQQEHEIYAPLMVEPFAERHYPVQQIGWTPEAVVFSTINDHGGYSQPLRRPLHSIH